MRCLLAQTTLDVKRTPWLSSLWKFARSRAVGSLLGIGSVSAYVLQHARLPTALVRKGSIINLAAPHFVRCRCADCSCLRPLDCKQRDRAICHVALVWEGMGLFQRHREDGVHF